MDKVSKVSKGGGIINSLQKCIILTNSAVYTHINYIIIINYYYQAFQLRNFIYSKIEN